MIPLKTEWHATSDVGAVRQVNEDRYLASDALGLWAIADGMGGMARGDWAAATVIETLGALPRHARLDEAVAAAASALRSANEQIVAEGRLRGEQLGTTAVLVVIRERDFAVLWVGDSRAYLFRDGRLFRLTRDHSEVQALVDRGILDPASAAQHPLRNVLTRALGVADALEIDWVSDGLRPDDLLLLCSDGLHGVIGEAEIQAILESHTLQDAPQAMVDRCHALGAPDNVTLIAISVTEATLLHFAPSAAGVGM